MERSPSGKADYRWAKARAVDPAAVAVPVPGAKVINLHVPIGVAVG